MDLKIRGRRMSTTAGGSLNACLPTSGSHSPKIIAVAVLSVTSKHVFFFFSTKQVMAAVDTSAKKIAP